MSLLYTAKMYAPQARIVRVTPATRGGCPAKDHAVPEKTAHASDDAVDLKAQSGLRKLAKKLQFMKYTNEDHKLARVSACVLSQEA